MNMGDIKHVNPKENPSSFADRLGFAYTQTVSQTFKKDNGQFFYPTGNCPIYGQFGFDR